MRTYNDKLQAKQYSLNIIQHIDCVKFTFEFGNFSNLERREKNDSNGTNKKQSWKIDKIFKLDGDNKKKLLKRRIWKFVLDFDPVIIQLIQKRVDGKFLD